MPHLTVHALEDDLAGREAALAEALTDSIAAVYGEWARELVTVQLIGVPVGRWAVGGPRQDRFPGGYARRPRGDVRAAGRRRGDPAAHRVADRRDRLGLRRAGRARTTVELVATPAGRTGVGGVLEE